MDFEVATPRDYLCLLGTAEYGISAGTQIGYGLSPREGLMVMVYFSESDQDIRIKAQFQALSSTGHGIEPHPRLLGADSITTRITRTISGLPRARVDICGDNVVIWLNVDNTVEKMLWIVCWVSGTTHLVMDHIYDARFLGPERVLVVSPSVSEDCVQLCLLYLDKALESLHFALPIPISVVYDCGLTTSPATRYNASTKEPFERQSLPWEFDGHLDICALQIGVARYPEEDGFLIVIRSQSLDAFGRRDGSDRSLISWNVWGSQLTRWLKIPGTYSGISIYGSQIYWEHPRGGLKMLSGDFPRDGPPSETNTIRNIAILDFNPRNVAPNAGTDSQSTQGLLCRDTWTHKNSLLTCRVVCSLPFVIYEVQQADWASPMVHEGSYIIDITRTGMQHILRVQSFIPLH